MKTIQVVVKKSDGLDAALAPVAALDPDLVLVFGSVPLVTDAALPGALGRAAPRAIRIGCSTAGEIAGQMVSDQTCTVTAVKFDASQVRLAVTTLADMADSAAAGERLAAPLVGEGLRGVIVLGQGVGINGSALVRGMEQVIGLDTPISGGLAGDGGAFERTWVLSGDHVSDSELVAIGLYGPRLSFEAGSFGGWQTFGPARRVTRCEGNVLFELDGEPALKVYERYLGEYASGLPATGLLFPFAMLSDDSENTVIRTILGIDKAQGSLTLAGEIQQDGYLKLMHANTDKLVDGATTAAEMAHAQQNASADGLALLVSCVGRKLVMGDRVDEEVEAVAGVFPDDTVVTGFYSYGEISPVGPGGLCGLHNQTMTVTYLTES